MMINCPKCNFLQHKDQYCAQCGIDMEAWHPPQKPKWKKIISNWIFQLILLFLVIFSVVLRDSFFDQTDPSIQETAGFSQKQSSVLNQRPPSARLSQKNSDPKQKPTKMTAEVQKEPETSLKATKEDTANTELKKKATLRVVLINRNSIEKLMQNSRGVGENAIIVPTQSFRRTMAQSITEFKNMGRKQKPYQFNQETLFFVGEEDPETNLNLGFHLQLTVFEESQPKQIRFGAQSWYQLNINGESSPRTNLETTMDASSSLIIAKPKVHETSFSNEESLLFETSQSLRGLVDEDFQEEISDIVFVLEIR